MVGNNYNQTLKELKSHFSERRAMALVCKLEKYMMQLVQIMHEVVELKIGMKIIELARIIEYKHIFFTHNYHFFT